MTAGNCIVRRMRTEDLAQVTEIEKRIFSVPWSYESFQKAMETEENLYFTAELDGKVAGYCGMWRSFEEGDIVNVAVAEEYRRRGIARAMLTQLLAEAEKEGITAFTLEVRKSNEAALGLYEALGFSSAGIRPGFYEKPREDAVIMWKRTE